MSALTEFTQAYVVCARWTEDLEEYEISEEAFNKMADDCKHFFNANTHLMSGLSPKQCGHDFWLNRNGHGEGFWSRGYGKIGDVLSDRCCPYGSCDLHLTDDNLIHVG